MNLKSRIGRLEVRANAVDRTIYRVAHRIVVLDLTDEDVIGYQCPSQNLVVWRETNETIENCAERCISLADWSDGSSCVTLAFEPVVKHVQH